MRYVTVISSSNGNHNANNITLPIDEPVHYRKIPGSGVYPNFLTGYIINRSPTAPLEITFGTTRRESQVIKVDPLKKLKVKHIPCDNLLITGVTEFQKYAIFEYNFNVIKSESQTESNNIILRQSLDIEFFTLDQMLHDETSDIVSVTAVGSPAAPVTLSLTVDPYTEVVIKRMWYSVRDTINNVLILPSTVLVGLAWYDNLGNLARQTRFIQISNRANDFAEFLADIKWDVFRRTEMSVFARVEIALFPIDVPATVTSRLSMEFYPLTKIV